MNSAGMARLPHLIPYQGSKRSLAPLIGEYVPRGVRTWFEPFAGSAAMTLWAASHGVAENYVISDVLEPICGLWQSVLEKPQAAADRYRSIWNKQSSAGLGYCGASSAPATSPTP